MNEPLWMPIARGLIGQHEAAGAADSPTIVQMFADSGIAGPGFDQDETPWCSAFVGACLAKAGFTPTKNAMAKSWSRWVDGIGLGAPVLGAITVIERQPPVKSLGHVFFLVGRDASYVYGLGGNQSDQVSIARFSRARIHSMWWPKGYMIDPMWIAPGTPKGWSEGGKVA
jgi:uncharacterized protein (TIGR02594 family)